MKAICFRDVESVSVEFIPDPVIEHPDDAIVKVKLAGLCGSDLHVYHGRETGIDIPTALGHEFVGEVVEVGAGVQKFRVGDLVCAPFTTSCGVCFFCERGLTCRCESGQLFGWRNENIGLHGGQAELVRVPLADGTLVKTGGMKPDLALLLGDNLSTGFFCAELAEVRPGGTYVVVGCGTVGLICIVAALQMGAKQVFAVDRVDHRLKIANDLGAEPIFDIDSAVQQVNDATEGRGADSVMELVGLPAAQKMAFDLLMPGGVLSTIGCHCESNFAFSPVDAYDQNLTYRTGRCPARFYMDKLESRVAEGRFDQLAPLISHRFSIDNGINAYEVFANRHDNCLKAVIDF